MRKPKHLRRHYLQRSVCDGIECLEPRWLLTVTPEFLADIRPGEVGSRMGREWIEFQGEIYFAADNGTSGRELWKTDGTESGTRLVKDIAPGDSGSVPIFFTQFQDHLYFRADDGSTGIELWRTDGTTAGTERFLDLNPGPDDAFPGNFAEWNGHMYFRADDGDVGSELFRTDGTRSGTELVDDIYAGIRGSEPGADSGFIPFGDWLYFSADGVVNGESIGIELYRTNGDVTELVLDADDGRDSSLPIQFTEFQGDLYFVSEVPIPPFNADFEAYLYRVDGESGEVERFFDEPVDFSEPLSVIGDTMFFAGGGDATGIEVYRTDGTPEGTTLLKDVFAGPDGSRPQNFYVHNDQLYFAAGDQFEQGANRVVHQIWVSDGTPDTTVKLSDATIDPETPFLAYRDEVYFLGNDEESGWELHKTNGTPAGTERLLDINPGQGDGFGIPKLVFEDQLLFLADNGQNGMEIWTWDGSTAEMAEVHLGGGGFTQEPELFQFIPYGKDLLFSGSTPFEGDELFVIRGSAVERLPGDADGNGAVDFADFLILSANFGSVDASFAEGDFDENGEVNFADFLLLSANFGTQSG